MDSAIQTVVGDPLALAGLTSEEANLVYNLEALDMPVKAAAALAGAPVAAALRPHVVKAREEMRKALREGLQLTREDVLIGLKEAITDARLLGDAMSQIRGWSEIAEILGIKKQAPVEININATVDVVRRQVKQVSDDDLIRQLGAEKIIDGEFYER